VKRIGFVDYYIDEWHANNYPTFIRQSAYRDAFEVALAWEEMTPAGRRPLDEWCREQGVGKAASVEEVIEKCDCIVVLSPDNAERHEDLADLPLQSGKPVYIDKPIAPSLAAAKRLFEKAEQHGTPMMSSSALRYGSAIERAIRDQIAGQAVRFVSTRGPGEWEVYGIHQAEMLVMTLGTGTTRVMACGNDRVNLLLVDYPDGRRGVIEQIPNHTFQLSAQFGADGSLAINEMDDFFPRFIEAMLRFFETGVSLVPKAETLEIAALLEAGAGALRTPGTWVDVP